MTRAADRLIVCGFRGTREPNYSYWHQMVETALSDTATNITDDVGEMTGLRWVSKEQNPIAAKTNTSEIPTSHEEGVYPSWLLEPAKSDPPLPKPLTPSGAFALIDQSSLLNENLKFDAKPNNNTIALQKGNATHKLLEVLPDIAPENRLLLATDYLDKTCPDLSPTQRKNIIDKIFDIFSTEHLKGLFEDDAQAEVSLAGRLDIKSGSMLVAGQIDRLIISDESVIILDYKTNRHVPQKLDDVPEEYITQIALYRDLVTRIYKSKKIVSALLWTQTPDLMVIPNVMLDKALEVIKNS